MNDTQQQPRAVNLNDPAQLAVALEESGKRLLHSLETFDRNMKSIKGSELPPDQQWPAVLAAIAGMVRSVAASQAVTIGALKSLVRVNAGQGRLLVPGSRIRS